MHLSTCDKLPLNVLTLFDQWEVLMQQSVNACVHLCMHVCMCDPHKKLARKVINSRLN